MIHGSTATNVLEPQAEDEEDVVEGDIVDVNTLHDDTHTFPSSLSLSLSLSIRVFLKTLKIVLKAGSVARFIF